MDKASARAAGRGNWVGVLSALAENVPGYRDYMARTSRLIPGIW